MALDTYDPRIRAARFELEAKLPKEIPLDFDALFPKLTGRGVDKHNRRRVELLVSPAPVLKAALRPDEQVLYALPCVLDVCWVQAFMGAWAQLINRSALVLTQERLLIVHLHGKQPASFVHQVPRAALTKVSVGVFSTVLKLRSRKITLTGLLAQDRKALKAALASSTRGSGDLEHLCPGCFAAHPKHVESSSHCGTAFKSPRTAALRSRLLPGLGDYYWGHRGLAVFETMGSLFTWAVAVALAAGQVPDVNRVTGLGFALLVLAVANGSDALWTRAQGMKGLMSLDGKLPASRSLSGRH
ncbi:MAG: hypothetical protein JW940_22865 [Polyangiaceae bacterium]|nr:hypothetical protein [Polyangiaceae bacterium]